MEQYTVTGMSCAACSARVEKAVSKVEGVTSCSVSLLTNSMGVEGTASVEAVIAAVEGAGYGATRKGAEVKTDQTKSSREEALQDKETPILRRRLIASVGFLLVLMYFSMGYVMWGWHLPAFFADNPLAVALVQLLLTIVVMVINQKFFVSGFKGLIKGAPNMDTLVALGATAAFGYSTVVLFAMSDAYSKGNAQMAAHYLHELYFESAAMILALITVGKMLEARSKGKTTDALKGLMKLMPQTAVILKDGTEVQMPIEQVKKGDIFVVRPGENIPVDGVVVEGNSAVNEAALTGESIPVDKTIGDSVSAATLNQSGYLRCEATRVGEDTTLSQIIQMVSDAAATKAPIAKIADKVSGIFVPVVIVIAVITLLVWLATGESIGFALARGISVLVISCPCALGLATPVAIMVGNGMGAKNGILFKTAVSLEETGKTQIVVLDKTGTITAGEPRVTDMIPAENVAVETLLQLAYSLEQKSEHPLARAILQEGRDRQIIGEEVTDFQALPGNGLQAVLKGKPLYGGNEAFIRDKLQGKTLEQENIPDGHDVVQENVSGGYAVGQENISGEHAVGQEMKAPASLTTDALGASMKKHADRLAEEGKTPLFFAYDGKLIGIIAVADIMKTDSAQAVKELQNMGIRVVMLTGDNERTAKAIGKQAGVDEVIAGVLPEGKEEVVRKLKEQGKVVMVGDGINDAPALTRADIGIAVGAGTDVAIDAADVVLMKSSLLDVPAAIRLSRATLRNIRQNLFWAFFYNAIGIPLAAGVFIPIWGWQLNPMFGAAAMSLSSFCVVSNALRLNWFKLHNASKDGKRRSVTAMEESESTNTKHKEKETKKMEKTLKIEGMMCGHCEARVKKTLEALEAVEAAAVSHEKGTAVVTLRADIADEELKQVVEAQDYKVLEIR